MSRRLVNVGLGAALLVLASGCQQPSPGITLVSGSSTTHFEAQQWCRDGKALQTGNECPGTGPSRIQLVRADEGGQVGIDVDSDLADQGWYVYDSDTGQILLGISNDHYRTFLADFSRAKVSGVQQLEVRTVDHVPTSSTDIPKVTGQWVFQVVAKV